MTNATQIVGAIAMSSAAIACLLPRRRAPWRAIAAIHAVLAVEILIDLRHALHGIIDQQLRLTGQYGGRHALQTSLLAALAITLCAAMIYAMNRRGTAPAGRIAIALTSVTIGLFLMETVSLHAIDALLYQPVGPILLIAFLWALLCAGVAALAVSARRTR
jgi:hypothetical protein